MSDTKTYKIDAVVAVDPRWVKHLIPSIEDEYDFEEDEELVSYNITAQDDGTQHLEMTVRVWPSSMKSEHDSIRLALVTGMEFEDHENEGVLQWEKEEVPSKTDKRKSRKIALSFSDTEVGTDEYGFIPRIDGEDPDDEEDRYQAYLKQQGVNATVAAGDIFLREDKMKIKLSELRHIIKEELRAPQAREVDHSSLEVDGIDHSDYPDYVDAYFSYGKYMDGAEMTDDELSQLSDEDPDLLDTTVLDSIR
jgi:hypothetical protein